MNPCYLVQPDVWWEHFQESWTAIGWLAQKDMLLRAFDQFALATYNTLRQQHERIEALQRQLDNNALDLRRVQQKVRA